VEKGKQKTIVIGVIAVIVVAGLGWFMTRSNERAAEKAIEGATGGNADVDVKNGKVSVKTDEGESVVGQNVSVPSDWPEDVMVYKGVKDTTVVAASTDKKGSSTVSLTTKDSAETVKNTYDEALANNGWAVSGELAVQGGTLITATKDTRNLSVTIGAGDDNMTSVTIVIAPTTE
jgi:hypothetical protein